jgi:GH15 family glucan-1,4-alpha-glucosidase
MARAVDRVMSPAKQKSAGKKTRSSGKAAASGDGKASAAAKEEGMPQSAAMPSPFPPIADYAFLSNCHTGALVAPDGAIDWLCVPRFDSPSIFGTLLDREAGSFRLAPFGINVPSGRIYEPGTNILNTTWHTPTGWAMVRDALTIGPTRHEDEITPHTRAPADEDAHHLLVRTVLCMDGTVDIELLCEPDFDYGRVPAEWSLQGRHIADAGEAELKVRLRSSMPLGAEGGVAQARHTLQKGEQAFCSLSWAEELASPEDVDEANARLGETTTYWRTWVSKARMPDHRFRGAIQRSALTIKGLTYMPTGATVAALTTSLPETPGGERNWDYRFTWIRDSTFTLQALHYLELDWEANEFMQFVGDLEPDEDGALQIMYGIDGRRDLTETTRDDLSGYAGASPVRVGNGAFDQRQNDVFGAALDSTLLHSRRSQRLPRGLWPVVQAQAECATKVWKTPDQGIWEARGKPQHYVSSKLMCWVAMDRASKLAAIRGDSELQAKWGDIAEEIRKDILDNGVRDGVLRQHYDTDALDASTLLAAIFGFLPEDDKVLRKSVLAIADDLTEDGFVLRYVTGQTDDGLSGKEGSFLICSFWLVSGLAVIGEHQRARDLMDRLLRIASPLGLYAEEFDTSTGRHLGNFPQAFSHLALIEAAARIILSERLEEFGVNV